MIPKLIHYSWFSGEPYPEFLKECMDTWKKVLPDYEFMLWDAKKLAECNNMFANEAVSVRKWAFAADFVRLYAVFLNDGMFIGREYYVHHEPGKEDFVTLTSHCFGAEREHPFIKECLEYYEHRHFIRSYNEKLPQELRYDMTIIPMVQMRLAENYGFDSRNSVNKLQVLSNGVHVYPYQWFDQPGYTSMKDVVCIHRVAQSWNPKAKGQTLRDVTNPKKKTLGYRKMMLQKKIADFILKL